MFGRAAVLFFALALSACTTLHGAHRPLLVTGECRISGADEKWIVASIDAWSGIRPDLVPSNVAPTTAAIFFDAHCAYTTPSLFADALRFDSRTHRGQIRLPSGSTVPASVLSFAAPSAEASAFFVMSVPSVWASAGMKRAFDLDLFLTAVMVHEISHVSQFDSYLEQSLRIAKSASLGSNVDDDIVQTLFAEDHSFAASIDEETSLLFAAAAAASDAECLQLAMRAREKMRERQASYYVGSLRPLSQLEDIFLTMEGSGQFAALSWLISPSGAALPKQTAMLEFGEDVKFWSQRHGLALFLVIDRLGLNWRETIYGDGNVTAVELLDERLK